MLDTETKRRIDTARDILVGKIPDPKSQIEQITIALIYKFMDDMDKGSVEMGGKASFFVGDYEKYAWNKIFDPRLGGFELVALYGDAIEAMDQNPNIPQLFRDIFKNAYLPYRDPETLKLFLKTINEFQYDHSERLGDAYEYLLSVLGSQGDAGQFRTPRHIIDFIVSVVDPQKGDRILDPACGTAGFLISAYKHIVKNNPDLSATERTKLMRNLAGYDISPDMVRLSLVNMFLHQFPTPDIVEYDTLTSEDRWNDYFDVIIANPPFMSPTGGIRPHRRFSVQARRSEVLFVDYIAEHINPKTGRAGIIVPEGIIFKTQNAYKELRKMLVEKHFLYAVVSLPAGVFNPYSGVKTSILFFDKQIASASDSILFVKVQNDGFNLGAQRREISGSELPEALETINTFRASVTNGSQTDCGSPHVSKGVSSIVKKEQIAESGEFNLSGERYRENQPVNHNFNSLPLSDLCSEILSGGTPATSNEEFWTGDIPWISSADIAGIHTANPRKFITQKAIAESATNLIPKGNIVVVTRVGLGKIVLNDFDLCISQDSQGLIVDKEKIEVKYLAYVLSRKVESFKEVSQGTTIQGVTKKQLAEIQIPLPPIEVQKEIVAKIENWQKIIDGARAVTQNYKPEIPINPTWPTVSLGDVFKLSSGQFLSKDQMIEGEFPVYGGNGINGYHNKYFIEEPVITIGRVGAYCGAVHITKPRSWITDNALYITEYKHEINRDYLAQILTKLNINQFAKTGGQPSISQSTVYNLQIPLAPLEVQQEIVTQIEKEQELINANKQLITTFEQKIKDEINKLWEQ